jgi:hypothetical protein
MGSETFLFLSICRTVAAMLSEALGSSFIEADDYHSQANKGTSPFVMLHA